MRIPHKAKVELSCSTDETRLTLNNCAVVKLVHPITGAGKESRDYLVGCDGRQLACIPVVGDDGECYGPVSNWLLQLAREQVPINNEIELRLSKLSEIVVIDGKANVLRDRGEKGAAPYPDVAKVIPDLSKEPPKFVIGLNVEKLISLAQSLGAETVKLSFTKDGPILVQDIAPTGRFGVLMPLSRNTY